MTCQFNFPFLSLSLFHFYFRKIHRKGESVGQLPCSSSAACLTFFTLFITAVPLHHMPLLWSDPCFTYMFPLSFIITRTCTQRYKMYLLMKIYIFKIKFCKANFAYAQINIFKFLFSVSQLYPIIWCSSLFP